MIWIKLFKAVSGQHILTKAKFVFVPKGKGLHGHDSETVLLFVAGVRRARIRTFVEESIYDEFVSKFMVEMKKWTLGNPRDPATKVGALVNEIHFNKVVGYLDQAVKENMVLAGHGVENIKVPEGNQKGMDIIRIENQ